MTARAWERRPGGGGAGPDENRSHLTTGEPTSAELLDAAQAAIDDAEAVLAADNHLERAAAYAAGVEDGHRARVTTEAEALAHSLIHARACEMLGLATESAARRHGPAWAAMVAEQGSAAWEAGR